MNFTQLNKILFTEANPNNAYVSWNIDSMPTSPRYTFENISTQAYQLIIKSKTRMDDLLYKAVFEYVNDENLCNTQPGMFPRSDRMTGNFYISEENFYSYDDGVKCSVFANFTELFSGGVITKPTECDYLGLEVNFSIYNNGKIVVSHIDSSSI